MKPIQTLVASLALFSFFAFPQASEGEGATKTEATHQDQLDSLAGRFSADDTEYFKSRPYLVKEGGRYFIEWTQGTWPFAFFADSKVKGGKAIFEADVSTSSGNLAGRVRRDEIVKKRIKALIESGEAYWKEPDGSLIKLELKAELDK